MVTPVSFWSLSTCQNHGMGKGGQAREQKTSSLDSRWRFHPWHNGCVPFTLEMTYSVGHNEGPNQNAQIFLKDCVSFRGGCRRGRGDTTCRARTFAPLSCLKTDPNTPPPTQPPSPRFVLLTTFSLASVSGSVQRVPRLVVYGSGGLNHPKSFRKVKAGRPVDFLSGAESAGTPFFPSALLRPLFPLCFESSRRPMEVLVISCRRFHIVCRGPDQAFF